MTLAGFVFTDALPIWFASVFIEVMTAGLRWVLAEAMVAEFSAPLKRVRNVGFFEPMIGIMLVFGPPLLVLVGPQSRIALWVVLGLNSLGLLWSLWIPKLPTATRARAAQVGLDGVWHAL